MLRSQQWNMPQTSSTYRFVENDELRAAMEGVFRVFTLFPGNSAKTRKNRFGLFATYAYDLDAEFCALFNGQFCFEFSFTNRRKFGKKDGKIEKFE